MMIVRFNLTSTVHPEVRKLVQNPLPYCHCWNTVTERPWFRLPGCYFSSSSLNSQSPLLNMAGWQTTIREIAQFRWGVYKRSNRSTIHYHVLYFFVKNSRSKSMLGSHSEVGWFHKEEFKPTISSLVQKNELMHAFSDRVVIIMYSCQTMLILIHIF